MLFNLDILDEDIERFRAANVGVLITGSQLHGPVAIVSSESVAKLFPGVTCYLPYEVAYLTSLTNEEAVNVHEMKRIFGGTVKPEDV